jgi:hypothetical protein
VYCHGIRRKLGFSLGQYTTVFQAEVYAIKACAATIRIEIFIFHQTVDLQLEQLANTRSPQNWSGTDTNPSYNSPDITEFN